MLLRFLVNEARAENLHNKWPCPPPQDRQQRRGSLVHNAIVVTIALMGLMATARLFWAGGVVRLLRNRASDFVAPSAIDDDLVNEVARLCHFHLASEAALSSALAHERTTRRCCPCAYPLLEPGPVDGQRAYASFLVAASLRVF